MPKDEMNPELTFPPLFQGEALSGAADPFAKACTQAMLGCESGTVIYSITPDVLKAAIVFAPEAPLVEALPVLIACEVGFQNALGALAPPEVSVHFRWDGEVLVNNARCGRMRVASGEVAKGEELDWIVVGLELPLLPPDPETPGLTPDQTCLFEEGCADLDPGHLLEAWTRHTLVWINRWADEGLRPLSAEWRPLVDKMGDEVEFTVKDTAYSGTFMGIDENFGMLLRQGEDTRLLPLSLLLEQGGEA